MKNNYETTVEIPEGINCTSSGTTLNCSKGNTQLVKKFEIHTIIISVKGKEIVLTCKKANKKGVANVNAIAAHIRNLFLGLNERFVYEMEICNVHFPMTVKTDKENFIITNFLGEKVPRNAKILSGVEVKVAGTKVTISSADIEKAGQTAANIEKASKVTKKDRRIFQDGIFITKKPGAEK
ncbi:MAG: 50S ribosomal protein L6 [Nanoarchaeota archaeon]